MPLQNRITPFGDIVAICQRGMFTGNRGIIHDPETRALLNRRWVGKTWLVCSCEYKDFKRAVMSGRKWTELFFLDEAVALAAGHRPCFLCRRDAAESFRNAFATARGVEKLSAAEMDDVLHVERLKCMREGPHSFSGSIDALPDGAIITAEGAAFTISQGRVYRWTEYGYERCIRPSAPAGLLTPPSTLAALRCSYRPVLHPSITQVY